MKQIIEIRSLMRPFIITIYLLSLQMVSFASVELYVSTKGNDNNPGTIEKPLASLEGAKNVVRKLILLNIRISANIK